MRIAVLTHEPFYPPSGGGSAEALYLVNEMVRRGHEVHVFCPRIEDPNGVAHRFGVRLHLFTRWQMGRYTRFRNLKYLLYPRQLARMTSACAAATPFDLLVSQHTIASVAAGRLRAKLHVPVVLNYLDFLTGFMESWPAQFATRSLFRRLQRFELQLPLRTQADGVMTVSDPLAAIFAETGYPTERLCPIYYGYDAEIFPRRSSPPPGDQPPVVVMHGSFDQHHLGPTALAAMIAVQRRRPDVHFRFVGQETATLRRLLKELRASSPAILTETTGFIPYRQVAGQLATATVGIIPYEESRGTHCAFVAKAVEYLGVGVPVVSTRLNNLAQYFKDEPRVRFSNFDGEAFAREILAWLDDPARDDMSAAARAAEAVRARLDWRAISRRAVDFMERTRREATSRHAPQPVPPSSEAGIPRATTTGS